MEVTSTTKDWNTIEATVTVIKKSQVNFVNYTSNEMVINGTMAFQLKLLQSCTNNGYTYTRFTVVFLKLRRCQDVVDKFIYSIKFTSKELNIQDKCFTSDDGAWHLLYENYAAELVAFKLVAHMEVAPSASSFASLHDDTELTDVELRGEDGSVHVHSAVLAAASPVLRRMLGGAWNENTDGHVDVPGTSSATLQHFKTYVYLHTLPDAGLEQLLLLAAHYVLPDLEQQCVDKLVRSVSAENACDLIEFAVKHKVTRLLLAVLECVQSGHVSILDMRNYIAKSSNAVLNNWAHLPFSQAVSIKQVK